jgi:hypothetical protein
MTIRARALPVSPPTATPRSSGFASRIADLAIVALLVGVAFLLGCYELADSDVWWHLRGGQWTLEHRHVPDLDPFTFGSEDRHWIDIHWVFEVVLASLYRLGGVPALILMAAGLGASALLVCLLARERAWPVPALVLAWMPAVVLMSWRFDPRPEIFTLVFLAVFLTVLRRADRRPQLLWLLLPVQIAWTNVQGLFVLGPIVVGVYLAARMVKRPPPERRWWRHALLAGVLIAVACLVNPYGFDGVRFPLLLYPKVSDATNFYKQYIDELISPRQFIAEMAPAGAEDGYIRALDFLLLALPLSFLPGPVAVAWRSGRADPGTGVVLFVMGALGLFALDAMTLGAGLWAASHAVTTVALLLAALGAGLVLWRWSRAAAVMAVAGGVALAGWMHWLREYFTVGDSFASGPEVWLVALAAAVTLVLLLRSGTDLFWLALAGIFAYLALQAVQNAGRFGLVAGFIMSLNFGDWLVEMRRGGNAVSRPALQRLVRAALACVLVLWATGIVTGAYYQWTGEPRRFALREQPFEHAHDAVRRAGAADMPARALVYDLGQASLFTFHNAPGHKAFLDGRLEMPAPATFRTYVEVEEQLNRGNPRWPEAIDALGEPLILLSHPQHSGAEAALLSHPHWRCVYFDALAALFTRQRPEVSAASAGGDFAEKHFRSPDEASAPDEPGAAFREGRALYNLAIELRRHAEAPAWWRRAVLLRALDRESLAIGESVDQTRAWDVLARCHWATAAEASAHPPAPADAWDAPACMDWWQATYCFRRALQDAPRDSTALRGLNDVLRARGITDSRREEADHGESFHKTWAQAQPAASAYLHVGQPADARVVLEQSKQVPFEALRLCALAATYWVERKFADAEAAYRRASHADPTRGEAWWGLTRLYMQQGRAAEAWRAYGEAMKRELSPSARRDLEALRPVLMRVIPSGELVK